MQSTHVKDLMEKRSVMVSPDATLADAARMMKENDCGFLPVGKADTAQGIITDRDIVIRAIAAGKDPQKETVSSYMTHDVCCCSKEDSLQDAAKLMSENSVSRLVVKEADGSVCGILTFGRIIRSNDNSTETSDVVQTATGRAA